MKFSPLSMAFAAFPLACYLTLLGSAVHTYFAIGHWPSYNNPDPHHLSIYRIASLAALAGLVGVVVCPVVALLIAVVRGTREKGSTRATIVAGGSYAVGAILWGLDFIGWRSSSGGLVNWIFD